jgi:predicted dehydrogenase
VEAFEEDIVMAGAARFAAGIVGTGFIGPVHVEALRRLGREVRGVVGSTPERSRAAAAALHLRAYGSLAELLADPEVKVVHLASPNHLHHRQCKEVIAAGKHVLCEKPLGLNSHETADLAALAERVAVACGVCYNVRYYPLNVEARQRLREGQLGSVYHVTGSYQQDWLLHDTDFNWRVLSAQAGPLRAVADIGTHWLDLVTWVTGLEVESVCADLRTFLPVRHRPVDRQGVETFQTKLGQEHPTEPVHIDTEDYGSVLLRFRGGASGCFTVSQVSSGRKNCLRYEVAGSRAGLAWDSERPNELWLGHRDVPNSVLLRDPALLHPEVRPYTSYPGGHNEGFPDTFKQLFRAFYESAESGRWQGAAPFPTFADGHREIRIGEAILRSHQERRWVEVG